MRLLLDTHSMYWYIEDDPQLSGRARTLIQDASNEILVSPASYWEIAIKISIGNYVLKVPYETFWRNGIDGNGFQILPIEVAHTAALLTMPYHHKDPFDRLMIAQAQVEDVPMVSGDAILNAYGTRRIW